MGKHCSVVHRYPSYDSTLRWNDNVDDPIIRSIAARIISQAVDDWIYLIRQHHMETFTPDKPRLDEYRNRCCGNSNFTEIRNFFNSQYGEMLCEAIDISPLTVLGKLEEWLEDYRRHGMIPKQSFRVSD